VYSNYRLRGTIKINNNYSKRMSDIFISYSRKDSEPALRLASFLQDCGHSVWMDQSDIHAAALWSSEIVRAISGCGAFILLLSPNSVDSKNVVRELALASEKGKHILPVKLERVAIPEAMEYQLAGIQSLPFGEDEALLHALNRLGLMNASDVPSAKLLNGSKRLKKSSFHRTLALAGVASVTAIVAAYLVMQSPTTRPAVQPTNIPLAATLMIMPLEDLSRAHNLGWLADGLVSELVNSLSSIQGIRMIDQSTSFSYRQASMKSSEIAKELNVRYFVEGSIRSSGKKFRILLQLFDYNKGKNIWNNEFEVTADQVFEIQESIARKVLAGMQLSLSSDEDYRLATQGTPRHDPHISNDR
jgi:TolB-like protein